MLMKLRQSILISCASLATMALQAQNNETHAVLLEWVRTEKLMAEEAADWREDRAVLESMIAVLRRESEQIQTQMAEVEESIEDSAASIRALADREASINDDLSELAGQMPGWESRALDAFSSWPSPLQSEVAALPLNETATADVWLSRIPLWIQRLQQADAFNRRVTVNYGLDSFPDGRSWEVSEIYFGLGGGFWKTRDGARAGWLEPSPSGWVRREDRNLSTLTGDMISIAERRSPSAYLEAPIAAH